MNNSLVLNFESLDLLKDSTDFHEQVTIIDLLKDIFPYYSRSSITTIIIFVQIICFVIHIFQSFSEPTLQTQIVAMAQFSVVTLKNYHLHQLLFSLFVNMEFDIFLMQIIFAAMIFSFIQKNVGKAKFCMYVFGTGSFGNILNVLITRKSCISNIGSLALFALSLKIEYTKFKTDNYIEYQNYNQAVGVYLYKFIIFSYFVHQLTKQNFLMSFYMYIGGCIFLILTQIRSLKLSIPIGCGFTTLIYLVYL